MRRLDNGDVPGRLAQMGLDRAEQPVAFATRDAAETVVYDWHAHDRHHQLLYALRGILQVETAVGRFVLPPQRALWLPAGVAHRTWVDGVEKVSLFIDPAVATADDARPRVLAAPPLMREMLLYAVTVPPLWRWDGDGLAPSFFRTLGLLCREWVVAEMPFWLPRSDDPALVRVMDYTQANLEGATLAGACAVGAMSERTLRRRFAATTGMGWHDYLGQSRMLRAMALLGHPGARVAVVAEAVGFSSLSAFAKSFRAFSGETPSAYCRRVAEAV